MKSMVVVVKNDASLVQRVSCHPIAMAALCCIFDDRDDSAAPIAGPGGTDIILSGTDSPQP